MILSKATQLETGGWHFTYRSDKRTSPHPCCRAHDLTPHATAEEAERCHYEYELSRARVMKATTASRCQECGEWTPLSYMIAGHSMTNLCEAHLNPDMLRKHHPFEPGMEFWES